MYSPQLRGYTGRYTKGSTRKMIHNNAFKASFLNIIILYIILYNCITVYAYICVRLYYTYISAHIHIHIYTGVRNGVIQLYKSKKYN